MLNYALMLALLCALNACQAEGSQARQSNADSSDSEQAAATGFVIEVKGAETLQFRPQPRLGCVRDQMQVLTMTQSPRFDLYLPAALTPGDYPLAPYDANAESKYVAGAAVVAFSGESDSGSGRGGRFYFLPRRGGLTIKAAPTQPGERLVAELDATLADRQGSEVRLQAVFDLELAAMLSMECAVSP